MSSLIPMKHVVLEKKIEMWKAVRWRQIQSDDNGSHDPWGQVILKQKLCREDYPMKLQSKFAFKRFYGFRKDYSEKMLMLTTQKPFAPENGDFSEILNS